VSVAAAHEGACSEKRSPQRRRRRRSTRMTMELKSDGFLLSRKVAQW
jgi:hypothetical protein